MLPIGPRGLLGTRQHRRWRDRLHGSDMSNITLEREREPVLIRADDLWPGDVFASFTDIRCKVDPLKQSKLIPRVTPARSKVWLRAVGRQWPRRSVTT